MHQEPMSAGKPLNILLVEDNPEYAALVERALSKAGPDVAVQCADSLSQALEQTREWTPSAILLDLSLPDAEPQTTIFHARGLARRAPLFVLTAVSDRSTALEALAGGVDDYFVKGQLDPRSLVREVRGAIDRRNEADPSASAVCLERDELRSELARRCAEGEPFAVTHIELDHFETLRDLWGEAWADRMGRSTADVLGRGLGPSDALGRLGDASFAVIHPRESLRAGFEVSGPRTVAADVSHRELFSAQANCGTAWFPEDGAHADTLLSRAEARCKQPYERDGIDLRIRLEPGEPTER